MFESDGDRYLALKPRFQLAGEPGRSGGVEPVCVERRLRIDARATLAEELGHPSDEPRLYPLLADHGSSGAPTTTRERSAYDWRHRRLCNFPLEVFGSSPGGIRTASAERP